MRPLAVLGLFLVACAPAPGTDEVGRTSSAIIGGRPSGDDENAAVYIENTAGEPKLRCSGRIIAPGLVVTARHCLLERRSQDVRCKADGTPVDITDSAGLSTVAATHFTVFIGAEMGTQRKVAVRDVLANLDITLCRGDIGYLVLTEPGLDTRTPLRRAPAAIGDAISVTGWGYVDDTQRKDLPRKRSTVETTIKDVGPGAIPQGSFNVPGKTLCSGDSGAAALVNGELLGIYSRIDNPDTCTSVFGTNTFTSVLAEPDLLTLAFKAIGEEPWFAGEQKPWLAAAGSTCATSDQCRGGVCAEGTCQPGCGPTGLACAAGQRCVADVCEAVVAAPDAGPPVAPAAPAPPPDSGCGVARTRARGACVFAVIGALALLRRRSRRVSRA